jgi:hypothetical protein
MTFVRNERFAIWKYHLSIAMLLAVFVAPFVAMYVSQLWLTDLRRGVLRFVPTEAVSFVVIPKVSTFVEIALPPVLAISSKLLDDQAKPRDLVEWLSPRSTRAFLPDADKKVALPSACPIIKTVTDAKRFGLDPDSDLAVMRLDTGGRAIMKFNDELAGMLFLYDVLAPYFIRLTLKEPQRADDAEYSFRIGYKSTGVIMCDDQNRKEMESGGNPSTVLPILSVRLDARNERGNARSLQIECEASGPDGEKGPCACHLFEQPVGTDLSDNSGLKKRIKRRRAVECTKAIDLSDRVALAEKSLTLIRNGQVVRVGRFYVGKLGEFFQIAESVDDVEIKQARLTGPGSSVLQDDSYLAHFRKMLASSKNYKSVIYGAARPDWLVSFAAKLQAVPLYLTTPFAVYFDENSVKIKAESNLQPQDMMIVQRFSAQAPASIVPQGWTRRGLGGAGFSDRALKNYVEFLSTYGEVVESMAEKHITNFLVLEAFMESSPQLVQARITDWKDDRGRMIVSAPQVTLEQATQIILHARQTVAEDEQSEILKQVKLLLDDYPESAGDIPPKVPELLCSVPSYWTFNEDKIGISEGELARASKSWVDPKNRSTLLVGAPNEPNFSTWKEVDNNRIEMKKKVDSLLASITEAIATLTSAAPADHKRSLLAQASPGMLTQAKEIESEREAAVHAGLSASIIQAKDAPSLAVSITALLDAQRILKEKKTRYPTPKDIRLLCDKFGAEPIARSFLRFDKSAGALYAFEDPADLDLAAPASKDESRAEAGKLTIDIDTKAIAARLSKTRPDDPKLKQLDEFPFPRNRVEISGHGKGVTVNIELRRDSGPQ